MAALLRCVPAGRPLPQTGCTSSCVDTPWYLLGSIPEAVTHLPTIRGGIQGGVAEAATVHPDIFKCEPMPQTHLHQVGGGNRIAVLARRDRAGIEIVNAECVIANAQALSLVMM